MSEQVPHDPWNHTAETVPLHAGGVPAQPAPVDGTVIEFGAVGTSPAPTGQRKRRRGIVIAATTAAVVLVGAGAYAGVRAWTGAGNVEPESVMPASVTAFARVDLNPGVRDKLAFDNLVKKFPTNGKSTTDVLTEFETKVAERAGLDYDTDVKPWFDGRVGLGAWTDSHGKTVAIVALASKDDAKAKATLTKVQQKQGDAHLGFAFKSGYALLAVAESGAQSDATAAATEAAGHPLAGNATYRAATAKTGDDNLLVAYADLHGLATAASANMPTLGRFPGLTNPADGLAKLSGTVAIGGRITDDGLEFQAHADVTTGSTAKPVTKTDVRPALDALPAGSLVAVATDGADPDSPALAQLQPMLGGLLGGGSFGGNPAAGAMLQQFSGLFTKVVTAKVISAALTGVAPTPSFVVNLQARSADDANAIVTPINQMFGTRLRITQNGDAVHAEFGTPATGRLADSPVYAKAMAGTGAPQFAAFVDVQALLAAAGPDARPAATDPAAVAPVKGIGITATSSGTSSDVLVRVIITK